MTSGSASLREMELEQACRMARIELENAEAAYDAACDRLRDAEKDSTRANRELRAYRRDNEG